MSKKGPGCRGGGDGWKVVLFVCACVRACVCVWIMSGQARMRREGY